MLFVQAENSRVHSCFNEIFLPDLADMPATHSLDVFRLWFTGLYGTKSLCLDMEFQAKISNSPFPQCQLHVKSVQPGESEECNGRLCTAVSQTRAPVMYIELFVWPWCRKWCFHWFCPHLSCTATKHDFMCAAVGFEVAIFHLSHILSLAFCWLICYYRCAKMSTCSWNKRQEEEFRTINAWILLMHCDVQLPFWPSCSWELL